MSFSLEQKSYIIGQAYKSSCCRRALLQGMLFAKGRILDDGEVVIGVERIETAQYAASLIREFYGSVGDISNFSVGGRRKGVSFKSSSASKYILNLHNSDELFANKCNFCHSAFLRGVFLASGRISDPQKQYSLDLSLGDRSSIFAEYLRGFGLNPRVSKKKNETVIYLKNISDIEDFFGFAGLNKAMFTFMDAKVEGELRKNAMRVANCETNNIAKTVSAARKQLEVIRALDEANLLSNLPEELEITARLRMENDDLSLAQLAAISVPPISKPGLSHRLKKIIEIGQQLLGEKD